MHRGNDLVPADGAWRAIDEQKVCAARAYRTSQDIILEVVALVSRLVACVRCQWYKQESHKPLGIEEFQAIFGKGNPSRVVLNRRDLGNGASPGRALPCVQGEEKRAHAASKFQD
jgi:hypothetical protein